MNTTTELHREDEHKSWLKDIERWNYDLDIWEGHSETLKKDTQVAVDTFLKSVKEHSAAVADLKHRIIECERSAIEHNRSEDDTRRWHSEVASEHDRRVDQHKLLEKQRHDLVALLKSFKQ